MFSVSPVSSHQSSTLFLPSSPHLCFIDVCSPLRLFLLINSPLHSPRHHWICVSLMCILCFTCFFSSILHFVPLPPTLSLYLHFIDACPLFHLFLPTNSPLHSPPHHHIWVLLMCILHFAHFFSPTLHFILPLLTSSPYLHFINVCSPFCPFLLTNSLLTIL